MTMKNALALLMAVSCLALTSCQQTAGYNSTTGALIGGASGAVMGSTIGGGSGRVAATMLGAFIGTVIGSEIGGYMEWGYAESRFLRVEKLTILQHSPQS